MLQNSSAEIRILAPQQEAAARASAAAHALDVQFRPLEDFLPGEGTGAVVATARGAAARAWLHGL